MNIKTPGANSHSLGWIILHVIGAALAFHLAYSLPSLNGFIVGYLYCLIQLGRAKTWRMAFYPGLVVGLLIASLQLRFFWNIFGPAAIPLWVIYAFWIGLFAAFVRLCFTRFATPWALVIIPFVWTGLEYFRSELYFLRFSWLNVGYTFSDNLPLLRIINLLGMYVMGFLAAILAAVLACLRPLQAGLAGLALVLATAFAAAGKANPARSRDGSEKGVVVAGVQLESPNPGLVISALNRLVKVSPEAELLVLSEYTFQDVVPERVKRWCRDHHRYLIVGGKDPAVGGDFYNTAFVIGPEGDIIFRQVKSVPIQFFKDGLPAPELQPWESPWGKIGICICYDLSYTRVTDRLIRQGAEALVVPTMDVADWGKRQHEIHARVSPVRAAEYGVPIFRVAGSGISQLVDRAGRRVAEAGFSGDLEKISGWLPMGKPGGLPMDRWLAPCSVGVTVMLALWMLIRRWHAKKDTTRSDSDSPALFGQKPEASAIREPPPKLTSSDGKIASARFASHPHD